MLYFTFHSDAYYFSYQGQFMATQLEKVVSSASKYKAAFDKLNAALYHCCQALGENVCQLL